MTLRIERVALPISAEEFAARVDAHIAALAEYDAHMLGVLIDEKNVALAPEKRRTRFPGPHADPMIEQAIRREPQSDGTTKFIADYELVEPAPPTLESRKSGLLQAVSVAEQAEIAKMIPPAKARYWQLQEQDIREADQKRYTAYAATLHPEEFRTAKSPNEFNAEQRPRTDTEFLKEQDDRAQNIALIQRWAAKQHFDIDDLTEETVDAWEMTPFNV